MCPNRCMLFYVFGIRVCVCVCVSRYLRKESNYCNETGHSLRVINHIDTRWNNDIKMAIDSKVKVDKFRQWKLKNLVDKV